LDPTQPNPLIPQPNAGQTIHHAGHSHLHYPEVVDEASHPRKPRPTSPASGTHEDAPGMITGWFTLIYQEKKNLDTRLTSLFIVTIKAMLMLRFKMLPKLLSTMFVKPENSNLMMSISKH
jgi:hypothetical protein